MNEGKPTMESQITKRPVTPDDKEWAREIHHKSYRSVVEDQFGPWNEDFQNKFFDEDFAPDNSELVMCDGEPCGYITKERSDEGITLHELVVSPDYQGKGIGSMLLKEVMDEGRKTGMSVKLMALKKNKAAELYRRMGFKEVQESDTHYFFEFDPKTERE